MKTAALSLPLFALLLGLAVPASAADRSGVSVSKDTATVSQQDTCKEDEVWDDETKKCVKKEG